MGKGSDASRARGGGGGAFDEDTRAIVSRAFGTCEATPLFFFMDLVRTKSAKFPTDGKRGTCRARSKKKTEEAVTEKRQQKKKLDRKQAAIAPSLDHIRRAHPRFHIPALARAWVIGGQRDTGFQ